MNPLRPITDPTVAVVVPCYRVSQSILPVVHSVGPEVAHIIVVDDACPQQSGRLVEKQCSDPRVTVVYLPENVGVGGAVIAGYRKALELGASVIVKLDGDGQMDSALIPRFIAPIITGEADYTKGNRFFHLESLRGMPVVRLLGNAALSFISKLSSGYWKLMDPTNGYTAIDARIAAHLPLHKISSRYFFESDMLFRLNTLQAVVRDIPMDAVYGDEQSNLRIKRVLFEFSFQHINRFLKRLFYTYFLRDFNAASLELLCGLALTVSGSLFGLSKWAEFSELGVPAPTGTVLLATIQVILGVQFVLSWITHDVNNTPIYPISGRLSSARSPASGRLRVPANSDTRIASEDSRHAKAVVGAANAEP